MSRFYCKRLSFVLFETELNDYTHHNIYYIKFELVKSTRDERFVLNIVLKFTVAHARSKSGKVLLCRSEERIFKFLYWPLFQYSVLGKEID